MSRTLLLVAAVLAGAGAAQAEDIIAVQKGPPLVGEIVAVEGDAFRLRTGDAMLTVEFWRVKPDALYSLLKARTALDQAAERIELAGTLQRFFCFGGARTELRAAKALDPALRNEVAIKLTDVDDAHAAWLLQTGQEAMADERFHDAVERLKQAAEQFDGSPAADKARELLPRARAGAATQDKPGAGDPKAGTPSKVNQRVAKAIDALVKRMDASLEKAKAEHKGGLRHDAKGRTAKAAEAYEAAAALDREARDWAQRVLQVGDHAPEASRKAAQERRIRSEKHLVLVYQSLASLYMVQKSFQRARSSILLALEIDPENTRALQLKAKIEAEMIRGVDKKDDGTPGNLKKPK